MLLNVLASTLDSTTPLLFAAMGGIIAQQAGMLNIGIEGMMLAGAFGAVIVSYLTGNVFVALIGAVVAAMIVGLIFDLFVVTLRANLIVVGLAINILAVGGAGYILPVAFHVQGAFAPPGLHGLGPVPIGPVASIPVLGPLLAGHTVLVYVSWLSILATAFVLRRSVWGIRVRAVGEDAEAARASGIPVKRIQYAAILVCAGIAGLAGAQLSLGELTLFNKAMTGGRGFIALAAFYFGGFQAGPTAIACFLFGFFEALQYRVQQIGIPPQLIETLPYVSVVVALAAVQIVRRWRRARSHGA